jgi:OOP family OmpA-OmpF porin
MQRLLRTSYLLLCALLLYAAPVSAQQPGNNGFQLNRYEPTAAGEWSFWVNHPWYSSTRYFAAGVTLNYAHNPLVFGVLNPDGTFNRTSVVIAHQLIGHIDIAGSFLDRVLLTLSMPIVFLEKGGTPAANVAAGDQVAIGDLRFGAYVRLFGQPYKGPISMSIGGDIWLPWRQFFPDSFPSTASDTFVRGIPRIILGGLSHSVMWTFTAGVLLRQHAVLGDPALGAEANSELQLGASIKYANTDKRFAIGPEVVASTAILGDNAFKTTTTNVEALLGIHYNIAHVVQLGVAGGVGILRQAGTPDGRVLLRLAYAPWPKPEKPKVLDRDHDGVLDVDDVCPDDHKGNHPDPARPGCPIGDRDRDGVLDPDDLCPDLHKGSRPDPEKRGCPMGDRDKDGVLDADDLCPDEPQGARPEPTKRGCPMGDRDKDGVLDGDDICPDQHQGENPDPNRKGCPAGDRDKDTVVDPIDACPDQPGAPSPDPKKNGCPGMVAVTSGQIVIVKPVFFATNKDVILQKSFEVLESVADALKASKQIKKIRIEGHTDNRGKVAYNVELSDRRAKSVMKWLIEHGIDAGRLEAKGYGPEGPIADNKKAEGRAKNRRVDFVIIDPPQPDSVKTQDATTIAVPDSPDQTDKSGKKGKKAKKDDAGGDAKPKQEAKPKKGKKAKKDDAGGEAKQEEAKPKQEAKPKKGTKAKK